MLQSKAKPMVQVTIIGIAILFRCPLGICGIEDAAEIVCVFETCEVLVENVEKGILDIVEEVPRSGFSLGDIELVSEVLGNSRVKDIDVADDVVGVIVACGGVIVDVVEVKGGLVVERVESVLCRMVWPANWILETGAFDT